MLLHRSHQTSRAFHIYSVSQLRQVIGHWRQNGGKMNNGIHTLNKFVHPRLITNITPVYLGIVLILSRSFLIHFVEHIKAAYLILAAQQLRHNHLTKITKCTGYQNSHRQIDSFCTKKTSLLFYDKQITKTVNLITPLN